MTQRNTHTLQKERAGYAQRAIKVVRTDIHHFGSGRGERLPEKVIAKQKRDKAAVQLPLPRKKAEEKKITILRELSEAFPLTPTESSGSLIRDVITYGAAAVAAFLVLVGISRDTGQAQTKPQQAKTKTELTAANLGKDGESTSKTTVATKAKVNEKPLEYVFPTGTKAILIGSYGGVVEVDSLHLLGVSSFSGKEKDTSVKTDIDGWVHIITHPTWPGLIFATEPRNGSNDIGVYVKRTKDGSTPDVTGSSNFGNVIAVPTNKGVIIRIVDETARIKVGYVNVTKELGVESFQNPKTQIYIDQQTGEMKILCTASNSSRKADINLGTGEVNSVPPETPLWRERADSTHPARIDSTVRVPIH